MHHSEKRPFGVSAIAVLLAIKGLASLAMALDLLTLDRAMLSHIDEPAGAVGLVTGLLLLRKAHGLWRLRHRTWLVMILLLVVDGATAAGELLLGTPTATVWVSLIVAVGIGLYLLQPSVRELFSKEHAGQ